jgi:hypothetical protein
MLGGSLVIMAWRVLMLRIEEKASRYGEQLRIYCIRSRGQPTRGGPPALALAVGLITPHRKKQACYEISQRTLDLDGLFA